jgi:putative tryptophan/tyrosine transport system substrate-binding protein
VQRSEMKNRPAVLLLGIVALLTSLGWIEESSAQTKTARVGILATPLAGTPNEAMDKYYEVFRQALAEQGWIEGKNIALEYRSARGSPPQFGDPAAELVGLKVDVIYANNAPATRAAYAATRSIPIVGLDYTNDPVAAGYVESYSRPGRNLTGFFLDAPEFASKWLELLKSMVPGLSRVVVLWDPTPGKTHLSAIQGAAQSFGVQLQILEVHKPQDIDVAFSALQARPQALIILPSPMTWAESPRLAELATKYRLPATSMADLFAEAGGMLSYGPDSVSAMKRTARLVAKVLDGAKPGDLPIERPTKFKLVVNQKTAKALGLTVPHSVLVSADSVIR